VCFVLQMNVSGETSLFAQTTVNHVNPKQVFREDKPVVQDISGHTPMTGAPVVEENPKIRLKIRFALLLDIFLVSCTPPLSFWCYVAFLPLFL